MEPSIRSVVAPTRAGSSPARGPLTPSHYPKYYKGREAGAYRVRFVGGGGGGKEDEGHPRKWKVAGRLKSHSLTEVWESSVSECVLGLPVSGMLIWDLVTHPPGTRGTREGTGQCTSVAACGHIS